ncbi:MAG: TATA-box-binding protein [Euryarchaeota archaeon]|nr:TATA-box-binding protein [Euryarchaeota archaeon]MBU4492434.1 TATA-box-binding protein [Euryarchaeota archaeon]
MKSNNFKIENVVSTAKLSDHFNLNDIKSKLEDAEYNKSRFPGLVYKINEPKSVFLLFNSGKVVCTGCKSIDDTKKAVDMLYKKLIGLGINIEANYEIIIQNIVASAELGGALNLNAVALGFGMENVEYEPEQFPGLVYRMDDPKVVILLFGSGKLVITGGKSPSDCENALLRIKDTLINLNLLLL